MNGGERRGVAEVDTACTDPKYWEEVLGEEGLAPVTSLFADDVFAVLDEQGFAMERKISSYGGNDCASGFPNNLYQLGNLIDDIIRGWPNVNVGLCIKTSCTTGDLKVVVYQKGVDGLRYHYNLRDIEGLTVERLQTFLERRFQNLNVHISNT